MKHASRIGENGRNVDPLLQSIAREIVERSCAAAALEQFLERRIEDSEEREKTVAALAEHRRELRRAEGELRQIGWKRDPESPLEFRSVARPDETCLAWRPEGTAFYRSLDVWISA